MSTQIKSSITTRSLGVRDMGHGDVAVFMDMGSQDVVVPRERLLDAIRTELNVIVIDKADLPEVVVDGQHLKLPGTAWPIHLAHKNLAAIKSDALDGLALVAYLEANPPKPPVDVEKVSAFSQLIREVDGNHDKGAGALAEALLATGRIDIKDFS